MKKHVKYYRIIALVKLYVLFSFSLIAQNTTISGTVADSNNEPLVGASVAVEQNNTLVKGTMTDVNGRYTLENVPANATLKVSFVGMKPQTILIDGKNTINVILEEDEISKLDEVLVIGYGTALKRDFTGSISQINTDEMMKAPVASFDQALAGRVAGVQITSSDGQPGDVTSITIRGASSLTQSNEPLYVIDGFPIDDPEIAATINPEEIESMNILKDASATAIYGARAANGVIIIETKKGKVQKPEIVLSTTVGFQQVLKKMEMMTPYEFVKYQMEVNPTSTKRLYTPAELPETDSYYDEKGRTLESYRNEKGIEWQDLLFREAPYQIYNLSVRGGNQDTRYAISGSITDHKGIILNTGHKRYQGRFSLNQNITRRLNGGLTANYSFNNRYGQKVNEGGGNSFTSYLLFRTWAYRPVSGNPDVNLLEYDDDPDNENSNDIRLNPIISSQNEHRITNSRSFLSSLFLNYNITDNLILRLRGSYNHNSFVNERFYNSRTPLGSRLNIANTKGINGYYGSRERNGWSNENTLSYRKRYNRIHTLGLMAGMSLGGGGYKQFGFSSQDIMNEKLGMYGLSQGTPYDSESMGGEYTQMSYFGRVNYDYKSKYILTATFRADGSSRFSKKNRWGYFPSAAIAWNMTEEPFMQDIPSISQSKIRISYGHTGNDRVGEYQYFTRMGVSIPAAYSFNNTTPILGTYVSGIGNENLKWETTEQLNIGYDLGLFKNRLELTVDWYNRITRDLLLNADMPLTSGFMRAYKNIGTIQNRGLELTLNTLNINKKNFQWRTNFNITFNQNKILALTDNQESMLTNMRIGSHLANLYISRVGYPAGMFFGYVFDGIYQVEDFDSPSEGVYVLKSNIPDNGHERSIIEPGHIRYKDMNGDNTIDDNDMVIIGRGQPIHVGGFYNDFQYKRINLSFLFQWSYGNNIYNANRMMLDGNYINQYFVNQYATFNDRWTPENRSNLYYKVRGAGPPGKQSTRVLEDGSYLRLKTLTLGYNIPTKVLRTLHLSSLNVYASGQNLLTFTKYSGMDPETSVRNTVLSPGYDYSAYPQARTVAFGINMTF